MKSLLSSTPLKTMHRDIFFFRFFKRELRNILTFECMESLMKHIVYMHFLLFTGK